MEDEDVLTIPEVLDTVHEAVWAEIYEDLDEEYDARNPYISSLRRNLQREYLERLVEMSMPDNGFGSASNPVQNLSRQRLKDLDKAIRTWRTANRENTDPYTLAHLGDINDLLMRIDNSQYIYNSNEMGGGGGTIMMNFPFGEDRD